MDKDTRAARAFYEAVANFANNAKPWSTNAIFHEIKPDEVWDLTLISQRVYGRRCEYLAVMAATGISQVEELLTQKQIILPDEGTLMQLKRQCNFESESELRTSDGTPTWSEE